MKIFGFEFIAKKAPPPVTLADVMALSQECHVRLDDLAEGLDQTRKTVEAMRRKVYRDAEVIPTPQGVVEAGAAVPTTPSNGRAAWRTGDPV